MLVVDLLKRIHHSFTQGGSTLALESCEIVSFMSMAIMDIYNYQGKKWSWMKKNHTAYPPNTPAAQYHGLFTSTFPSSINKVNYIVDLATCSKVQNPNICNTIGQMGCTSDGNYRNQFRFQPGMDFMDFANNQNPGYISGTSGPERGGYMVNYEAGPEEFTLECGPNLTTTTKLPLPDQFQSAIYDLTMSYSSYAYGQGGEMHEDYFYKRAYQKLEQLALSDPQQGLNSLSL